MIRSLHLAVALVLTLSLVAGKARAAEPEPLATTEELQKMYADGQYQPLLAKLPRVLALKGQAAAKYDLVALNLLKADTFVQLKQQPQAINATNDAVKAITEQTPADSAAKARAQQILFKQSPGLTYTSKADRTMKPIPLADMAQRKAAYNALLGDMKADIAAKIKAAQSAKALPPIITAVQSLSDMGTVETVATGSDKATATAADDLAGGAKNLITKAITEMSGTAMSIDQKAKEMIPYGVRDTAVNTNERGPDGKARQITVAEPTMRMRGLTNAQRDTLREIADTCDRVVTVCRSFEQVSKQHAEGFKTIEASAQKVLTDSRTTLDADYTGVYVKGGRVGGYTR
jgi:hypothetical protein